MKRLVVLLLVLSACGLQSASPGSDVPDIHVGTQGLDVRISDASPSEMQMCSQSSLFIELHNRGATDIQGGRYAVTFEAGNIQVRGNAKGSIELEGKSVYNQVGELTREVIRVENTNMPEQVQNYATAIGFIACYPYKTTAAIEVCIDPDIQGLNKNKVCKSGPVSLSGGQGAPVAVTLVEPHMTTTDEGIVPNFEVEIEHVGDGRVIHEDGVGLACGDELSDVELGNSVDSRSKSELLKSTVQVSASMQGTLLDCQETVQLDPEGKGQFYCKWPESLAFSKAAGTFTTILSVELSYGYEKSINFPLTVKRIPGQKSC